MGNGIKMRNAVDVHGTIYSLEALQLAQDEKKEIPDLYCADPVCRKPVRFVQRHQQNRKGRIEPIDVPPYIGLTSDSEHTNGCRYNAAKRIAVLVDQSDPDFVGAVNDGKRDLRLLVLHNGLSGKPLSGNAPPPSAATGRGTGTATKQFIPSGNMLDSYLRTTADLLALRELCDSDALLAEQLTLRFGPKRIAWSDFFFTRDRYDEAWELLKNSGRNTHPLALVGEVKSHHSPPPGAKYKSTFLNCRPLYRHTDTPNKIDSFEVSAMHADAGWLNGFPVGTSIILFGLWEYKDAAENTGKDTGDQQPAMTYVTRKLMLKPKFKAQIIKAF